LIRQLRDRFEQPALEVLDSLAVPQSCGSSRPPGAQHPRQVFLADLFAVGKGTSIDDVPSSRMFPLGCRERRAPDRPAARPPWHCANH
jgi:hypothetical protein